MDASHFECGGWMHANVRVVPHSVCALEPTFARRFICASTPSSHSICSRLESTRDCWKKNLGHTNTRTYTHTHTLITLSGASDVCAAWQKHTAVIISHECFRTDQTNTRTRSTTFLPSGNYRHLALVPQLTHARPKKQNELTHSCSDFPSVRRWAARRRCATHERTLKMHVNERRQHDEHKTGRKQIAQRANERRIPKTPYTLNAYYRVSIRSKAAMMSSGALWMNNSEWFMMSRETLSCVLRTTEKYIVTRRIFKLIIYKYRSDNVTCKERRSLMCDLMDCFAYACTFRWS